MKNPLFHLKTLSSVPLGEELSPFEKLYARTKVELTKKIVQNTCQKNKQKKQSRALENYLPNTKEGRKG